MGESDGNCQRACGMLLLGPGLKGRQEGGRKEEREGRREGGRKERGEGGKKEERNSQKDVLGAQWN